MKDGFGLAAKNSIGYAKLSIITDDFVYIHYPKTGGTFVTHVLKRLYQYKKKYKLLTTFLPKRIQRRFHGFIQTDKKHGTCDEIPELHRNKPILATIRNPYDRYVSHYEFG
ncbi:MAG: sulfotransferase family 2 domain-containing protein, partial [Desulfobacterales bacterium]